MRYWVPTIILLFTLDTGCSSIKTTAFDRLEDDTIIASPDKHLKGVPVSLKIPTHLELTVEEKTFWHVEGTELVPVESCRATRTVDHDVKYIEKVFMVDPVRPGAAADTGSSYYGFSFKNDDLTEKEIQDGKTKDYEFSGKGQLTGLNYKIQDESIKKSALLLASSLNFIKSITPAATPTSAAIGGMNTDIKLNLLQTTRVVAWSRFDLNSEHFEEDVMEFLDRNINHIGDDQDYLQAETCK